MPKHTFKTGDMARIITDEYEYRRGDIVQVGEMRSGTFDFGIDSINGRKHTGYADAAWMEPIYQSDEDKLSALLNGNITPEKYEEIK